MNKRFLGSGRLEVSALGFGCMGMSQSFGPNPGDRGEMLACLGGCEPQLAGHVAGNLNVGNGRSVLLNVLTQLIPHIGYPRTLNALRVLDEATLPRQ